MDSSGRRVISLVVDLSCRNLRRLLRFPASVLIYFWDWQLKVIVVGQQLLLGVPGQGEGVWGVTLSEGAGVEAA